MSLGIFANGTTYGPGYLRFHAYKNKPIKKLLATVRLASLKNLLPIDKAKKGKEIQELK